jgi:hypothetical protein
MRVRDDGLLRVSFALRRPDSAGPAIDALRGNPDPVAVEGLFELVVAAPTARLVVAALGALASVEYPLVAESLRTGIRGRHPQARLVAVQLAHRRKLPGFDAEFVRVLKGDESWPNRRAALLALADSPERWEVLAAADDPHWRVRHALIRVLLGWGATEDRAGILRRLREGGSLRARGVASYLEWAWAGIEPGNWSSFSPPDSAARCPFWDWDPAVLAAKLNRMGRSGRTEAIDAMPFLAGHEDERVWKPAVDAIHDTGKPWHFAGVLAWLNDPRHGSGPAVERLFSGLDGDRIEEVARYIVETAEPTPGQLGWIGRQLGDTIPRDTAEPWQPRFEGLSRAATEGGPYRLVGAATEGGPYQPVQPDVGPFARAAALTPKQAAALVADPHRETSWHVLERACRLAKRALWEIEPERPWSPAKRPKVPASPIDMTVTPALNQAYLGRERLAVSRIGVSGHYLLPVEGFTRAVGAGVNWFFWEPNYATLTEFAGQLNPSTREQLRFVAGTFEAESAKVRKDVERALRTLKVERLGLFLVFWVQSWDRLTDELRFTVERLREEGKVTAVGLSSHNRPLLVRAMEEGWGPVMARHSAAHRGVEEAVFPKAAELGTTLLTFNNLCYGRMLKPVAGMAPPDPTDCYRYTLSFSAVSACWSAPATVEQLEANLRALFDPELPAERKAYLQRFGAALYREETVFLRLVRVL